MISHCQVDETERVLTVPQSFLEHLAQGLHAAAQPLTILLAGLANEHTEEMQGEELRKLAAVAAVEVQRVCGLFHYLQQLLAAESALPEMRPALIDPVVQHVVEGVRLLFEESGVNLRWAASGSSRLVLLDRGRTAVAVTHALITAHAVSRRQETVMVSVSSLGAQGMRIEVRNEDAAVAGDEYGPREIAVRLSLAVAEANIRSQQGVCSWGLRPFVVDMILQQVGE